MVDSVLHVESPEANNLYLSVRHKMVKTRRISLLLLFVLDEEPWVDIEEPARHLAGVLGGLLEEHA